MNNNTPKQDTMMQNTPAQNTMQATQNSPIQDTILKRSFHQLYSRPILFIGLLLLLAGAWRHA